jgi:cell division septal protein FtsQ
VATKVATRNSKITARKVNGGADNRAGSQRPATKRVEPAPNAFERFVHENLQWLLTGLAAVIVGILLFVVYKSATASSFFSVKNVDIAGTTRTSHETIEKAVRALTDKSGVWQADLTVIQSEVESLPAIKTAAVSRVLPDILRVRIVEREPKALVRLEQTGKIVWVDDEAKFLGDPLPNESTLPFVMQGWNEGKDEIASKLNQERVQLYLKLLAEWSRLEISDRVAVVNLSNLQNVTALIKKDAITIAVELGNQKFGERLKSTWQLLEEYAQNGTLEKIEKVIATEQYPIVSLRETNERKQKTLSKIIR